jgi:L-alanine-DL-glutamate epimerase-like enolase superfamily enzyme
VTAVASPRIVSVEWARLEGRRPRKAGSNARLGEHGIVVRPTIARITADDCSSGFGSCWTNRDQAQQLLGQPIADLFTEERGVTEAWRAFDYPLWDLAGRRAGQPGYALAAAMTGRHADEPFRAPCYDTSLYFDDLHLASTDESARLIAAEAREGYERGHRAFKIKVGRGARHLPLEVGTRRDIAVVRAVRDAVGPEPPIMLDANNGYNLNLAKRVLEETVDCGIFWLEEAFHEDRVLYTDLREWLKQRNLSTLIADGEGQASPTLLDWARDGIVDVIQYDIYGHGFTRWLETGRRLDSWGARSAPHHYGGLYGNYASCHLAAAFQNFTFVEWDEAATPALDASRYSIENGHVLVPDAPGFGLELDDAAFRQAVSADGFALSV